MKQREAFIRRALQPRANISELCREFGISRSVGHKILRRYRESGKAGIVPYSRRPKSHALQVSAEIVCEIVALRQEHPRWGGQTIRELLLERFAKSEVPCARSVDRVLERAGMVRQRRSPRGRWLDTRPANPAKSSNELWTVDFKGWWRTKDKVPCFPLTIRDAYSRYIISIEGLRGSNYEDTKDAFERAFERYGMPKAILSDNGAPFASVLSLAGLTRLSAWWVKLGIMPRRILPGCPFMNGSHERMHVDMKAELQSKPGWNIKEQQKMFDEWRNIYNNIRPNQAIGKKKPAQVYKSSEREYPAQIPEFEYPITMDLRRTSCRGFISWHQKSRFVSGAIAKETVGIKREEREMLSVWFCELKLGSTNKNFDYPLGGNQAFGGSPYSHKHARNKLTPVSDVLS